jgi:hypothetical protein
MFGLETAVTITLMVLGVFILLLLLGITFVMANRRFWKAWRIGIFWESERSDAVNHELQPRQERTIIEREPDVPPPVD